jgi:eukaryotic-like serine/threonine-protein kinase
LKRDSSQRDALSSSRAVLETSNLQQASPTKPKAWKLYSLIAAAVVVLAAAAGAFFLHRSSPRPLPANSEWEQLTFFTDSAVYPALSPDGRMLAFIRGADSFLGVGELYVKMLPSGEPVQLSHDGRVKLAPSFSPDNSKIVFSVVEPWDTWEVPVLGGEPHMLLPNSSSLTWIEGGKRLLFSEIKEGLHMALVTTDENRGNSRDVYLPDGKRSMAHHSYISPDGKWVLVVEMDSRTEILPCRVVPFQGGGAIKLVGPPGGECHAGAWSPDGKWIYLAAKTDDFHLWRQRFPDGEPEQITFGPTSQDGIAMAPDGKSLVTSVGSQDQSVWLHDKDGDHQVSSEGNSSRPEFSADGHKLYFLMDSGKAHGVDLWAKDLDSGKEEQILTDFSMKRERISRDLPMEDYAVSRDGKQVAFAMNDESGRSNLWIAPTSHRSSPIHIPSVASEDSPTFLPDGDLIFRAIEGGSGFLYRMKSDGSDRRKVSPQRILDTLATSPDGRWVLVQVPTPGDENTTATDAIAVDGSAIVPLSDGYCMSRWDTTGKYFYVYCPQLNPDSHLLSVLPSTGLPKVPPAGFSRLEDFASPKTNGGVPWYVESAVGSNVYAYTRDNTRRNLYRIQLP